MSSSESRLISFIEEMHPDMREAFLRVLEWMDEQQSTPTADQIVKLVHSELAQIIFERHLLES